MSTADFYRAFEERYRGSRELIRERLAIYLPFVTPLRQIYHPTVALDLGCGRGEWLELLQSHGFESLGIDMDGGMLAACVERELPAIQGDAVTYLKSLANESQCIISGFHVAEHIAFEDLNTLVIQSLRVLKPGGLLILETPNPENLIVGSCNFYLDPTHQRPIPPQLLSFLPEHYGFARIRTMRLQEPRELIDRDDVSLMDVLGGVSPDYAIVAQKSAMPEILTKFDTAFSAHHGLELRQLAQRYDNIFRQKMTAMNQLIDAHAELASKQVEIEKLRNDVTLALQRIEVTEANAQEQEQRAIQCIEIAEASAQEQEQRANIWEVRANELGAASHHWWLQASALEAERNSLRRSWSWRITAPIRWAGEIALKLTPNSLGHRAKTLVQQVALHVVQRPRLSQAAIRVLDHFPSLKSYLQGIVNTPANASTPSAIPHVPRTFEALKSVQIMTAVAHASEMRNLDSIVFLNITSHDR